MFAYHFEGYWKDVGTIDSLWEANMDLLTLPMPIRPVATPSWRIYARNPVMPPHFIGRGRQRRAISLITEGCEVYGHVGHSVLFSGVTIRGGGYGGGQRGHARRGH